MTTEIETKTGLPEARFKIFTGLLKAYEADETGEPRLSGIASSTTRDHHGDSMEESALRDMEAAANNNMTIFLNHSYNVPEDVAGSVERAVVVQRGYDGDGNPNWDLDMDIAINRENDRAVKSWNAIKNGTKLGLSIGAMIPEGGATRNKDTGALTISRVTLLETSIVSIPANPRSWISNAVKALNTAEDEETFFSSVTSGTVNTSIESTLGPVQVSTLLDTNTNEVETDKDASELASPSDEPVSQEASESEPEHEDGTVTQSSAEDADLELDLDPVMMQSVDGVLALLETTTAKLVEAREATESEKRARLEAERQRDEAAGLTNELFAQANSIFTQLAETPVGRKTSFQRQREAFADLDGIYSESFRKLLNK